MKQVCYILEILRCLNRHGGSAVINPTVYDEVLDALRRELTAEDWGPTNDGLEKPKWKNETRQAHRTMVHVGLLKRGGMRGRWEISDKGREHLARYDSPVEAVADEEMN